MNLPRSTDESYMPRSTDESYMPRSTDESYMPRSTDESYNNPLSSQTELLWRFGPGIS
jgi:hypothetical protein